VPIADPRIERFRVRLGEALHRLLPFGGYALPLSPPRQTGAALEPAASADRSGRPVDPRG
jgi:hypothetical protein